ncbi:hypothetical protein [Halalkalirubrum salinum]|uniref:hypothetical protein n=1 Tax=Halalkalirubrum salinum TaxID=2563889 RepID=UPI0010FAE493|nr:hypothetical protein [Halalkalirubrum salinum]
MTTFELADAVQDVLAIDLDAFRTAAEADGDAVIEELRDGTFDNHQSIIGLEYEFYAVSEGRWRNGGGDEAYSLCRVPRRLLELIGFEKELGLHNAEMTTSPQPFNEHGLRAQESEVRGRLQAALDCTTPEGMRLVSDGLWTVPPAGETARSYLTDSIEHDGIRIATNMTDAVRYHAMANSEAATELFRIDVPHVSIEADTVMPESLITSIQPHYQVQQAEDLPRCFNYAVRIAGPLLALGVNSPFFPADLYDDAPPKEILSMAHHENRITIFESVLNSATDSDKVRFPRDLDSIEDAVHRVVDDETMVPMPVDRGERFDDSFATLRRKHGTYWRWVRPVFDGATRSSANARIEFRPLAAQPTVRDSIALQAAFAGLMEGLTRHDHPLCTLPWEDARQNFRAAAEDGFDSGQRIITTEGTETSDPDVVFSELLDYAEAGLTAVGLSESEAGRYLEPLRWRVTNRETPASWKRSIVAAELDAGQSLGEAIETMQRRYVNEQQETLLDGSFADWTRPPA